MKFKKKGMLNFIVAVFLVLLVLGAMGFAFTTITWKGVKDLLGIGFGEDTTGFVYGGCLNPICSYWALTCAINSELIGRPAWLESNKEELCPGFDNAIIMKKDTIAETETTKEEAPKEQKTETKDYICCSKRIRQGSPISAGAGSSGGISYTYEYSWSEDRCPAELNRANTEKCRNIKLPDETTYKEYQNKKVQKTCDGLLYGYNICVRCSGEETRLMKFPTKDKAEVLSELVNAIKSCYSDTGDASEEKRCSIFDLRDLNEEIHRDLIITRMENSGVKYNINLNGNKISPGDTIYIYSEPFGTNNVVLTNKQNKYIRVAKKTTVAEQKFTCYVDNFEMPQYLEESMWAKWIGGYGDPKYLMYYQAFPVGEDAAWHIDATMPYMYSILIGGVVNMAFSGFGRVFGKAGKAGKELVDQASEEGFKITDDIVKKTISEVTENIEGHSIRGLRFFQKFGKMLTGKQQIKNFARKTFMREYATNLFKEASEKAVRETSEKVQAEVAEKLTKYHKLWSENPSAFYKYMSKGKFTDDGWIFLKERLTKEVFDPNNVGKNVQGKIFQSIEKSGLKNMPISLLDDILEEAGKRANFRNEILQNYIQKGLKEVNEKTIKENLESVSKVIANLDDLPGGQQILDAYVEGGAKKIIPNIGEGGLKWQNILDADPTLYGGLTPTSYGTALQKSFDDLAATLDPTKANTFKNLFGKTEEILDMSKNRIMVDLNPFGGGSLVKPKLPTRFVRGSIKTLDWARKHNLLVGTALGIYSYFAERRNEKYMPVGRNNLALLDTAKSEERKQITTLPNVAGSYFIYLDKKTSSDKLDNRFFLASPCSADLTVKNEKAKCYYPSKDQLYYDYVLLKKDAKTANSDLIFKPAKKGTISYTVPENDKESQFYGKWKEKYKSSEELSKLLAEAEELSNNGDYIAALKKFLEVTRNYYIDEDIQDIFLTANTGIILMHSYAIKGTCDEFKNEISTYGSDAPYAYLILGFCYLDESNKNGAFSSFEKAKGTNKELTSVAYYRQCLIKQMDYLAIGKCQDAIDSSPDSFYAEAAWNKINLILKEMDVPSWEKFLEKPKEFYKKSSKQLFTSIFVLPPSSISQMDVLCSFADDAGNFKKTYSWYDKIKSEGSMSDLILDSAKCMQVYENYVTKTTDWSDNEYRHYLKTLERDLDYIWDEYYKWVFKGKVNKVDLRSVVLGGAGTGWKGFPNYKEAFRAVYVAGITPFPKFLMKKTKIYDNSIEIPLIPTVKQFDELIKFHRALELDSSPENLEDDSVRDLLLKKQYFEGELRWYDEKGIWSQSKDVAEKWRNVLKELEHRGVTDKSKMIQECLKGDFYTRLDCKDETCLYKQDVIAISLVRHKETKANYCYTGSHAWLTGIYVGAQVLAASIDIVVGITTVGILEVPVAFLTGMGATAVTIWTNKMKEWPNP